MVRPRTCRLCGAKFTPTPDKPGRIDECLNCAKETVERIAGITVWEGKHTPVTILCTQEQATNFAAATRRPGPAPSLHFSHREKKGEPGSKTGTGAEPGALYRSKLNEKRSVKR